MVVPPPHPPGAGNEDVGNVKYVSWEYYCQISIFLFYQLHIINMSYLQGLWIILYHGRILQQVWILNKSV